MFKKIDITTDDRVQLIDVTSTIKDTVKEFELSSGLVHVFCPHSSACITINESTDPNVKVDLSHALSALFPHDNPVYTHVGTNADAHLKGSVLGVDETFIVDDGALILGKWQAVYFCEFDGPRMRHLFIKGMAG